jgi:hypothetical protein
MSEREKAEEYFSNVEGSEKSGLRDIAKIRIKTKRQI